MKKAVIAAGGKQYIVTEGETVEIELVDNALKKTEFVPLLVIDGDKVEVGRPDVAGIKVTAEIIVQDKKSDKVTSLRYKAKKRVHTVHGHRQRKTLVKVTKIA